MKRNERLLKTMGIQPELERKNNETAPVVPKSGPGVLMSQRATQAKLEKVEAELEYFKFKKIPLIELHEVEGRKRTLTKDAFDELKANLAVHPLLHAVVVRKREEGGYEVIAGHNRIQAYRELGRTEIEADIQEVEDEAVYEAAFYSNLFTSALTDFEKYEGFKNIQSKTGENQKELAERAGVSTTQISNLFSFDKLPDQAKQYIRLKPDCIGFNTVAKITKGEEGRVVEAIMHLASGKFNEIQSIKYALNQESQSSKRANTETIKAGKKTFAEITSKENLIAIRVKDINELEAVKEKVRSLLEELAFRNS